MRTPHEPSTRSGYLLAAVIWALVAASLLAGPPRNMAKLATLECSR